MNGKMAKRARALAKATCQVHGVTMETTYKPRQLVGGASEKTMPRQLALCFRLFAKRAKKYTRGPNWYADAEHELA